MNEWISVEERLPDGKFLAVNMNQGGVMYVAWLDPVHGIYEYTGGRFCGLPHMPNFTHWMPLPEPPA